ETELPPNPCILTFDDGLADHYEVVFPLLLERGLRGAFFPPARPLQDDCVLEVHKIHFILAAADDHQRIAQELLSYVDEFRSRFSIPPNDELCEKFAVAGRFDLPQVSFIKQLLQWGLPAPVRTEVITQLFTEYVSRNEA